jgi:DNA polymerase
MSGDELGDLRGEARALASSLRALVEELQASGADALPHDPTPRRPQPQAHAQPQPHAQPRPQPPPYAQPHADPPPHAQPQPQLRPHAPPFAPAHASPPARPAPTREPAPAHPLATPRAPSRHLPQITLEHPADPVAGLARLDALARDVAACTACALHATRTQTVFSRGTPQTELMFVGEGPGADEDAQGLPFVGKAGQLLDKMIAAMGYRPDDVYIANVVKCRPPGNRTPEPQEMEACEGYLHEQIAIVRPKVIVALGNTACLGLLQVSGITRLRGKWRLYRGAIPVMPTFHPSYLLRTEAAKREVWEDLKLVMGKLGKAPRPRG